MIMHEKATDKNIITKQVVINTLTSARLLPITADEKVIDEIQQALNELERLKKKDKRLLELTERDTAKKVFKTDYNYCPNCHQHYLSEYSNYCSECGQRLDWSE